MPLISPEAVQQGDRLALSRLLTQLENQQPEGQKVLDTLYPLTGQAYLVGITGAPGTGKSSLVNRLARVYREPGPDGESVRVGIIAVDPSSPFSGGAVLGDRVRMLDLSGDPGVFIRSTASRGSLGGLAATTSQLVQAMDAAGYQLIMIETVGAGQAEVEIAQLAHTTIVIEAPGLGDEIQTIKAGILEIADVLIVNKADLPGAERAYRSLVRMLTGSYQNPPTTIHHNLHPSNAMEQDTSHREDPGWQVPVLLTSAAENQGILELKNAINSHREYLKQSGEFTLRETRRIQSDLDRRLENKLVDRWRNNIPEESYQQTLDALLKRQITPNQALKKLTNGEPR